MKNIQRLCPVKHAKIIAKARALWANRDTRPITQGAIARICGLTSSKVSALVNYRTCIGGTKKDRRSYDILWLPPDTPPENSDADLEAAKRRRAYAEADALFATAAAGRQFVDHGVVGA
jgi:hypothetical protein